MRNLPEVCALLSDFGLSISTKAIRRPADRQDMRRIQRDGVDGMGGKRTAKQPKEAKSAVAACAAPTGDDAAAVVRLPVDCRLAAQAGLKAQFEEVLHKGDIVLDVEGLERVDTAALQLLVLFRRELESRGGKLAWRGTNAVLDEAASLLGLEQLLNLPAATLA